MKIPVGITRHPAVAECLDAEGQGFADYKYDVQLMEGWVFQSGRMADCASGRFNTVAEFKSACPVKKAGIV